MVLLEVKTSYSILESLCDIKKLVSKAVSLNYSCLAITDNNNMFGAREFYLECKKNNIKPIIGIELDVLDKKIILLAINNMGYKNLIKLSTLCSERNIGIDDLIYYKDNLILIMPYKYKDNDIYNIYDIKYIGYSNKEEKELIEEKKVFINNVSYIEKEDYMYLDYLNMIRLGKVLGEYELNRDIGKHLLSKEEFELLCDNQTITNMKDISNMCNVSIEYMSDLLPIYDDNIDSYEYLTNLCNKGLKKRLNNIVNSEYENRLDYELDIINKMGFCDYFLIVWDYVKYAKFHNILVGPGRGSAAGSLVSYTLGITDIDPIKYDLLFERFLNPERVTMPDIDIDFDASRRNEVIDYVTNKYGEKKVAGIITFNSLGSKQVIRDLGRVMNINLSLVDEISKCLNGVNIISSYNNSDKLKRLVSSSNQLKKLFKIASKLEGLPRHISVHAAGIVMSRKDIDESIPLYKNQLGQYVTGYSMNYLEELGLLKMDFLGISNLTLISEMINNIRNNTGINISFDKIPIDDKKSLEIFYKVDTNGIFQFESVGMKSFLQKLKVSSFDDIVAAIALFRPGPMDNIDTYVKRKNGNEKIEYLDESLKPILESTYGIIIYQEQIMQIALTLANYTLGEADVLRRAMSKKKEDVLLKERDKFINNSISNGYSKDVAIKVYELILKFANYGFNKSHSVSYSLIAYKMAFLKQYFPIYFITSILNNSIGSDDKTKIYINEAKTRNIKFMYPNINISGNKYIIKDNNIVCPLSIIRNVGTGICNEILKEREKGEFVNFVDFVKRMYSGSINKRVIVSLIKAGCFIDFNKNTLIENLDRIINYAELCKDSGMIEMEEPSIIEYLEYDKDMLINDELEVFGFYLTDHPVNKYKTSDCINTIDISNCYNNNVKMVLNVDYVKEIITKKNDVMAFIKGSDEYGNVSLTLFPNYYNSSLKINKNSIIEIYGRVEKRYDEYQIIVNKIKKIN